MNYTTDELIQTLEQVPNIKKFFTKFFGTNKTTLNEKLEVQVKKGKKRLAPFVAPRIGGVIMERDGFSTYSVTTPKLAPSRVLTIDNILKQTFGEHIKNKKTPEERADEIFAKDLTDLEEYIANRKEWMARQIILEGNINVIDIEKGVDINIDYNFTNKDTLVGGAMWSEATSDPIADIKSWRKEILKKSGVNANMCIMGENAFNAFLNHNTVKEKLNLLNVSLGEIKPQMIDEALTFQGKIEGIEIYTFDEWILNDEDIEEAMMPIDSVLMVHKNIGEMWHGSVTLLDDSDEFVVYENEIIPQIITDKKASTKELTLYSRPLPVPFDVDSWFVAKVL